MRFIIIGCSVAGVTAARELKKSDMDISVEIIGAEPYPYYYRPRLWELIANQIEEADLFYRPVNWYDEQEINLTLNTHLTQIFPEQHTIELSNGEIRGYDRLLLANGANPNIPPFADINEPGVFVLRDIKNAKAIMKFADTIRKIVVIGGGLLGLETARSLKLRGAEVEVVEFMTHLLPRQLDKEGGKFLQSRLEEMGLNFLLEKSTEKISKVNNHFQISFKDGSQTESEMILLSTGIRPRIELPRQAGLEVQRAVLVDEYLQTSAADIYAAGDIAEFNSINYGIIPAAIEQAKLAAANMLNPQSAVYTGTVPFNKLKVTGIELVSLGEATTISEDYTILRKENHSEGKYLRLTLKNNRIVGAIMLGDSKNWAFIKQFIENKVNISEYMERLLQDDFDWKGIARR